jgi:hypothetical protein
MHETNVIDMGGHWLFPLFFGLMTLIIGIVFVKYVFFPKSDKDKDKQ